MTTNYRELLGIQTLEIVTGINKAARNLKQKKAIRNIKYCANDQWAFVNSWLDARDEDARAYMMNPRELFDTIYDESLKNVYDEGSVHFGTAAEAFLKDVRFCGKEFLEKVVFFYTAKLLEESVEEVEGTDEDAQRVLTELQKIYNRIFGEQEDALIHELATGWHLEVKKTRDGEEWIELSDDQAQKLWEEFTLDTGVVLDIKRTKLTAEYKDGSKYILSIGKKPYLWCVK